MDIGAMNNETQTEINPRRFTLRHLVPEGSTRSAARRFGVGLRQARRIITGESPAGLHTAIRIALDFPGKVSIEELCQVEFPPGVAVRRSEVAA